MLAPSILASLVLYFNSIFIVIFFFTYVSPACQSVHTFGQARWITIQTSEMALLDLSPVPVLKSTGHWEQYVLGANKCQQNSLKTSLIDHGKP